MGVPGHRVAAVLLQRSLRFCPPARVYAVGSWAAQTMARPGAVVDIALEVPKACFDEKDQLNERYFARRAQWLGEVAGALRKKAAFKRISWDFMQDDIRSVLHAARFGVANPLFSAISRLQRRPHDK